MRKSGHASTGFRIMEFSGSWKPKWTEVSLDVRLIGISDAYLD